MPSARLFSRGASRRLVLLALTASLAALLVSLAATETGSACSTGPPPKPLRALYTESDLVVVARAGQTVPVEMASLDQRLKVYLLKTNLNVDSTLKGQGNHGLITLYSLRWVAPNQDEEPALHDYYSGGDKLLFFLKQRVDGEGYEQADPSYGVKTLSDAELRVYVERMNELALIMQQEKPDPARIVEWLVRCAEEPATRWEGLYELITSKNVAESKEAAEKEAAAEKELTAEAESGEESGEAAEGEGEADQADLSHGEAAEGAGDSEASPGEGDGANADPRLVRMMSVRAIMYTPDPELAGLLTAEQKKRLADVLFNVKEVTGAELSLIAMVKEWRDPRFVPFALAQLRRYVDDPPYFAEPLMTALAESLGNEGLMKLAESYSENSIYYDEEAEATAEGDEAGGESGDAAAAEPEVDVASEEETAEEKAEEEDPAEKAFEESLTGNSAQKRKLRLQRFIARAEVALAN